MDVTVVNLARGGRSARSYTREGLFATLVSQITPGDYVIIEFGHNDGYVFPCYQDHTADAPRSGSPSTSDRASVYGSDDSTETVTLSDGTVEVVQTFVTYEKNMVADVLAAGGIPIVSSQTPNGDAWNDAKTEISDPPRFVGYAEIAASETNSVFLDHWSVSHLREVVENSCTDMRIVGRDRL
jgi:rhamnogalacturonan acetylesterase